MTTTVDLIEHAADILSREALCLRQSHTHLDRPEDWGDDVSARAAYDDLRATGQRLYALADELRLGDITGSIRAADRHAAMDGIWVCHAVSRTLLPAVQAIAQHLERTQPRASAEQRIEMIFAAGVVALMRAHGREASDVEQVKRIGLKKHE